MAPCHYLTKCPKPQRSMPLMYKKSLFIFRRDVRIEDNTGLIKALSLSEKVLPCFIINPQQVGPHNSYRSMHAIQFMVESLKNLHHALEKKGGHLFLFYGIPEEIVEKIISAEKIDAVFVNEDYTPYSRGRDAHLQKLCKNLGIDFISTFDALLIKPEDGVSNQGTPYKIFTPFYKKNSSNPIALPVTTKKNNYVTTISGSHKNVAFLDTLFERSAHLNSSGGRSEGLIVLSHISDFKEYPVTHDIVALPTTNLSAHIKFGTLSIREVAHAIIENIGTSNRLLRQLYWRDFFYHIAWFYPHVFGSAFHEKYNQLDWNTSEKDFARWCEGTTGFPLVDAGMRQLNETGFMHNRARLVVGSFLTKDLHINWLWAEKYFAQKLLDYDPSINNGNWQWIASTGSDAQPYFRVFNPWLQQKKFDPECIYIKRWVPELKNLDVRTIHAWFAQTKSRHGYPSPCVNHAQEALRAKIRYKRASRLQN